MGSSFFNISISLRGNGLDPELLGDDTEDCAGEGGMPLLAEDERRNLLVDTGGSAKEPSLGLLLAKDAELAGEVPWLTVMTPATPLPAGRNKAPEGKAAAVVDGGSLFCCAALS